MLNFYEFLEQMQIRAIAHALTPGADYIWREKCREYSIKFSTALHLVYDLDPEFVIQNLYETEFNRSAVQENMEEILGRLNRFNDPDFEEIEQAEIEELVDRVINKENKRKGKTPNTSVKPPVANLKAPTIPAPQPTQGGLKFDSIAKSDESEFGRDGYKE